MKSRISFFNKSLFKKDITRFAPLWALYTVGLLLTLFSGWQSYSGFCKFMGDSVGGFAIFNLIYAALAAQLLFGDLFQSRLCNALHAMPMRRETRFFTHLVAGLSFSIVPTLLAALISAPFLEEYWFVAPMWLLSVSLSYVAFFGIAVFSMLCTGSRFAMAAVYAIINFGAWVAYWFAETVYLPMMNGVELAEEIFQWFSPVVAIAVGKYFKFSSYNGGYYFQRVYEFKGYGDGWLYLSMAAVAGVALLACALVLYRRRKLESAGDFMAVRWLRPVFLLTYTLCAGAFLAMFGSIWGGAYLILLIFGILIGFFTGYMLLERTIRVFRKGRFLQAALLVAALLLSIWATKADLFGIVRWVPEKDQVKLVQMRNGNDTLLITHPEEIETILSAHEAFLSENDENQGQYMNIWLTYTLKSGREVTRHYAVRTTHPELLKLKKYFFSTPEAVFELAGSWEDYKQEVLYIIYEDDKGSSHTIYDRTAIDTLLEALYADCKAGTMAQSWAFHDDAASKYLEYLTIYSKVQGGTQKILHLTIYGDAVNTQKVLSKMTQ